MIKWGTFSVSLFFIISLVLLAVFTDDTFSEIQFVLILTVALLFGLGSLALYLSKVVIGETTITSYKWYGKKSIRFSDIKEVDYTSFFGGCIVLKDGHQSVWVPIENVGTADFVKLLCAKVGQEQCGKAVQAIYMRKQELARFM
ncbi:hypothetical protein NDK47_08255 [Brevibacillus ruminantium]|uniref:PH domain-containing protein n=1 Tax=Brevibacillus ruminantium TaxID=2950604 RepID=A0ABY4WJD9_9BACL|nr:hypothetical protein [Brevibacillus ruminantium]USG67251.1 hypothetical protein NDK47_08255 [Brevibacillus ruminantium]